MIHLFKHTILYIWFIHFCMWLFSYDSFIFVCDSLHMIYLFPLVILQIINSFSHDSVAFWFFTRDSFSFTCGYMIISPCHSLHSSFVFLLASFHMILLGLHVIPCTWLIYHHLSFFPHDSIYFACDRIVYIRFISFCLWFFSYDSLIFWMWFFSYDSFLFWTWFFPNDSFIFAVIICTSHSFSPFRHNEFIFTIHLLSRAILYTWFF